MKPATLIARLLLGAIFIVFGLNFWLKFIPIPPPPEGTPADGFLGVLYVSGYLAAVKVLEVLGGLLVASGRFTGAGLLILGPIILNILFFDFFLAKAFNPVSTLAGALGLFLLYAYRAAGQGIGGSLRFCGNLRMEICAGRAQEICGPG